MSDKEKYEELCEALVGIDATERYSHEDIISYVYNLKNIEEKSYEKKKPTIDAVTLDLINKLKAIQDTVNEGAWEYVHIGDILRLQDVFHTAITHFDLKKKGGIGEYGNDKGKYTEFWHSDYVCHTDPEAYDPSKVEEEDDE